jgi:hypothetical protein
MDLATFLLHLARRWWLVAAVTALAVFGAALALAARSEEHRTTIHFVLRPDSSLPSKDLPNALEELKSDGPLVQTVIGVLGSQDLLRRAASNARVSLDPDYAVTSTARPGSALIDSTLAGPDAAVVGRLAAGFTRAGSDYVAANYSAYTLDRLGAEAGSNGTGLSAPQAVILALVIGTALGVGLVAAELRLEPRLRPLFDARAQRRAAEPLPAHCRAVTSKGTPCRNRPVDERGYCRMHLGRIEAEDDDRSRDNGSSSVIRLGEPTVRALEPADRRRARARRKDEA